MKTHNLILIKTSIFLLVVFLSCSVNNSKDKTKNDLIIQNLKGHVKKLTETHYDGGDIKFGEVQKGNIVQTFTYSFNKKGYKVEDSMNNPYTNNYYRTTYKYDKKGNQIEECFFEPDNHMPTYKKMFTYDNRNRLVETNDYNKEGIKSWKIVYTYDLDGNRIESNFFTDENGLSKKIISKFENNKMIEECRYNGNGNMINKTTYIYNDKSNQVEESRFNSDGRLYYKFLTKNSEDDLISETSMLNQDMPYESLINLSLTKFDNHGNFFEENQYSLDGKLQTKHIYKYPKYDKEGNWLIQERVREICNIKLADAYPNSVVERVIEYFNK